MKKSALKKLSSYNTKQASGNSSKLVKIGEASQLLGVSIDTLRRWEKKGWLKTVKTPGGTRLYDKEQLIKLNPNLKRGPKSLLTPIAPWSAPGGETSDKSSPISKLAPILLSTDKSILKTSSSISAESIEEDIQSQEDPINDSLGSDLFSRLTTLKANILTSVFALVVISILFLPVFIISNYLKNDQKVSVLADKISASPAINSLDIAKKLVDFFSPQVSRQLLANLPLGSPPGSSEKNIESLKDPAELDRRGSGDLKGSISPTSQTALKSLKGQVLAESTPSASFLQINLDTELNGNLAVDGEGFFTQNVTAPNLLYGVQAGTNISITGDAQNPTISTTGSNDTLQTVTERGASTTIASTFSGGLSVGGSLNLGQLSSDPSSAVNGATYYNTSTNKFKCYINGSWSNCDTDTTGGDGDITGVTAGNGLTGGGSSGSVTLTVDATTTSTTTTTSANSGLEATSTGVRLLGGCTDAQVLRWNASTTVWECKDAASTAVFTIQESDTTVSAVATTLDFLGGDFDLTESPSGEVNIVLASTLTTPIAVAGDFDINGGDLTTTQTTATLFNTTTTTLSLGAAATTALNLGNGSGNYTAINLGSGSGTHTINIAGTGATGADTINIGSGGTAADTITIGNTASSTSLALNAGSGGTTITNATTTSTTFASTTSGSDTIIIKPQTTTTTNAFSATITSADLTTANQTFTLPDLATSTADTFCIKILANCFGSGSGGVSATGTQNANEIAYFTGDDNIDGDSSFLFVAGTTTGNTLALTNSSLTTGKLTSITGTSTPAANTATTQNLFDVTYAQSTTANTNGFVGLGVNFTNNPSVAGNTEYAARIQNQATTNTTDNAVSALLLLDNADTSSTGSTVVTDALRITNSGDIAAGITNAINIDDADITTDIVLQNDETIDNNVDGTIALGATTLSFSGTTITASSATALNCSDCIDFDDLENTLDVDQTTDINLGANNLTIDLDSTGIFDIRDGATTYWSFDDDSTVDVTFPAAGVLTIDASTTANTTTAGVLDLNVTSSTTNNRAASISTTFTSTGATTSYGLENLWSSSAVVTGASVSQTGYGLYNTATKTGADDATGTYSLYGLYSTASNTGSTAAGTKNTYGGYFDATGDAAGTSSAYGVYIDNVSGADTNVGLCFDCDGTWTASTVASGIQFGSDANAVTLYRSASDTLKTDDSLSVGTNFDQAGGSGTFATGTGAVSLNGDTTVAAGKNLSMASGVGVFAQTFTPAGTTATATAATISQTVGIDATDQTLTGLIITTSTNSDGDAGDTILGIDIGNITASSAVESALRIGSGWDNDIYFEKGTNTDVRLRVTAASGADRTATVPALTADDTFCFATLANCTGAGGGSGVTFTSQTTNALTKFTSTSGQITSSNVTDDGTTVTVAAGINFALASGAGTFAQTYTPSGATAAANGATLTPTFGIAATDQTLTGLLVNPNTNSNTDTGDILYGINIDSITDSSATQTALRIGSSYDNEILFEKGSNDLQLRVTAPTGATRTLTIPALSADADVCLTSGNCAGSGTGVTASPNGADNQIAFFTAGQNITSEADFGWDDTNNLFTVVGLSTATTSTTQAITSSAQTITSGGLISAALTSSSATASFTGDIGKITSSRTNDTAAQTLTDTGNLFELSRTTITNNASATTNVTGALFNITNTATQTAGTLSDSANLVAITQDADATGAPLYINTNRSGSNNALLIEQSSGGTDIFTITDAGNASLLSDLTVLGGDITGVGDESIDIGEASANTISLLIDAAAEARLSSTALFPVTAEGNALGTTSGEWEALYVGDDNGLFFGLDQDFSLGYDEATDDRLELTATAKNFAIALTTGAVIISGSADGTDAFQITAGDATITNGDLDVVAGDFNVTLDDQDTINLAGTAASSTAGNGAAAANLITATGPAGQATSGTTGQTGGAGSAFSFTGGVGGAATGASGSNIGGAGGALTLAGGAGGAATSGTGGAGGAISLTAGAAGSGGNANGGTLTLNSGAVTGSGTSTLNLASSNATTVNLATATSATTLNIGAASTTAVTMALAGGSSDTGCTLAGATGNFTCSGNITGSSSGTVGFWTRTSTTLSPATANDIVSIANTTTTGADFAVTNTGVYTGTGVVNLTANSLTTGVGEAISTTGLTTGSTLRATGSGATMQTGGELVDLVLGANTVGAGMTITSTGAYTGTGAADGLINVVANSLTSGLGSQYSFTGLTTGSGTRMTGSGATMQTGGELVDLALGANTVGAGITVTSTGAYTGTGAADGLINVTANSLTTGLAQQVSTTGLTTGSAVRVTGSGATMQTGGELVDLVMGANTVGAGMTITSTGAYTGTGAADGLINVVANSLTSGYGSQYSFTGLTTGSGIKMTGSGATMQTGGELIDLTLGANTVGAGITITSTGAYTGTGAADGLINLTANSLTTGYGTQFLFNGLTSGRGINVTSSSAVVTTGSLIYSSLTGASAFTGNLNYIDWTPGSSTTASGDLFELHIGPNGTTTGKLFNIVDDTSSVFSVSETTFETSLPSNFTSAGDVSLAYDLVFTNPTASFIKSYSALTLQAGDPFGSSNLSGQVYNAGSIVFESASSAHTGTNGLVDINVNSTTADNVGLNVDATVDSGATAGNDFFAQKINLTQNDADADQFGLVITSAATTNAAAGSYEALLKLDNAENTIGAVTDAILIDSTSATDTDITTGLNASDSNITNAINIGQNFILGDTLRQFSSSSTVWTFEDTSGNDLVTITDNTNVGDVVATGTLSGYGTSIGLNNDASANNTVSFGAGAGQPTGDLYWGSRLLCTAASANCGWAASGGTSPWTTTSNVVNLNTSTDNVTIGSSTALGKLAVDGDADEIQLQIQGNATQTTSLVVFENSAGTDQFTFSNTGSAVFTGSADGTDALTLTTGDILVSDGDLDISGGDFNVTLDSGDGVTITGTQPASVGTTPGTAATAIIGLSAATGGNTTIATTGTGGVGSGLAWTLGTGGTAASANTASTGGAGGAYAITSGTGGASTAATGTNVGGAGGAVSLTGGTGGAASGGSSNTGGAGGAITILAGSAGSGGNANGGTLTLNSGAVTGSGTSTLNLASSNATTVNLATATSATTLNIGAASTTAVTMALAGGSSDTGCTLAGATGNFTCSGNITGSSSGTVGFWTRTGTTLEPATDGDVVTIDAVPVGSTALTLTAASGVRTLALIDINENNTTGTVPTIQWDSGETRGGLLDANLTGALGTENFIDITGSAAFTSNLIDINTTAASSGNVIDITTATAASSGNLVDLNFGNIADTGDAINISMGAAAVGAQGLVMSTSAGIRTASAIQITENNTTGTVPTIQWDSAETRGGLLDANLTGALGTENFIDITGSAAFTSNLIDINTTAASSGNVIDITTATAASSGNLVDLNFGNIADTGDAINISMGAAAVGAQGLVMTTSAGIRTASAIDITENNTTGTVASFAYTSANTRGGFADWNLTGALGTEHFIDIDTSAAWTSNLIDITSGAQVVTGNYFDINVGNAAQTGDVFNTDITAGAVALQYEVITNAAISSTAGWLKNVTTSAAWTGNAVDFTTGAQAWTGNVLDFNFGNAAATGDVININNPALAVATQAFVLDNAAASTTVGWLMDINATAAFTAAAIDIDTTAASSGNIIDITTATAATSGNLIDLNFGNIADTGDAINISMGAAAVGAQGLVMSTSAGIRTASAIQITENNTTGAVPTIQWDSAQTRGGLLDVNATGALGTEHLIDITASAAFTSNLIDINTTAASSGNVIDVTTATTASSGNLVDLNFGNIADTGDAINISMGAAAVGAQGLVMSTSAGIRTASAIDITENNTTGTVASFAYTSANTRGGFADWNLTGALGTEHFIDIDTSAAWTSNLFDITTGAQATTGNFFDINLGNAAHTGDIFNIDIPALAVSEQLMVVNNAAASTVNLIDITSATTTGNLFDLTANSLTTGSAFEITSTATALAGTATTGDGLLANFDWNPGSASTTGTGDLFRIRIDDNGTLTSGSIFNIVDESTSIFSVKETAFETSLPSNFTAAGDVSVAYDLVFTNPTASYIKSAAPLYLAAGETFNSSDLTLSTYNSGAIILDTTDAEIAVTNTASTINIGTGTGINTVNIGNGNIQTKVVFAQRTAAPGADFTVNGQFAGGLIGGVSTNARLWFRANNLNFRWNSTANTADYSEFLRQSETSEPGDVMVLAEDSFEKVKKTDQPYDQKVLGVVTKYGTGGNPGTCWDEVSCDKSQDPNWANVGMLGQVYTKVSVENGNIKPGDPLVTSSVKGVAMKATKEGRILGYALDFFDGSTSGQDILDNPTAGTWDVDTPSGTKKAGKILILLQAGWYDPTAPPPDIGQIQLAEQVPETQYEPPIYSLSYGSNPYDSQLVGSNALIANLEAGSIDTENLWANNLKADSINVTSGSNSVFKVNSSGNVILGSGNLTTSSTDGFAYLPSVAGLPTAAPTSINGHTPITYDKVNNKICAYNAGWNCIGESNNDAAAALSLDTAGNLVVPDLKANKITVATDVNIAGIASAAGFNLDASSINQSGALATLPINAQGKVTLADVVNSLNSQISQTSQTLSDVQFEQASQSAQLAEARILGEQAVSQAQSLDDKVASTSANLASLSSQITDLLASFGSDNSSATDSGQLDLTPPAQLIASSSAQFANINVTDKLSTLNLSALDATVSATFKSLGETFLGTTTIAGDLSVDGTLSFTNGNSINAFPTLFLQNNPLAQAIDIFNGGVSIDATGLLSANSLALGSESLGEATIGAGQIELTIPTSLITPTSRIFLTPLSPILGNLYVGIKTTGYGFKVRLSEPNFTDVKFNWMVIQSKEASN